MAQNSDLIEIVATAADSGCGCTEADLDFIDTTNGVFKTQLSDFSGESVWQPLNLTIGSATNSLPAKIVVQSTDITDGSSAEINVRSPNQNTFTRILPSRVYSETFRNDSGSILISSAGSTFVSAGFGGTIYPLADSSTQLGTTGLRWSHIWTDDITIGGTATIGTLSLTDLTLSGNLNVAGTTILTGNCEFGNTLGNGQTIQFHQPAYFWKPFEVDNNIGQFNFGSGNDVSVGSAQGGTLLANFRTICPQIFATQYIDIGGGAPASSTHAVRKTDVNIGDNINLSGVLGKITVTSGYITNVEQAAADDLPNIVNKHKSTTETTNAPPIGTNNGQYPLTASDVRAVDRTGAVVKGPLKMTNNNSSTDYRYTGGSSVNYFVVIENGQTPDVSGPEGQIIFRKSV